MRGNRLPRSPASWVWRARRCRSGSRGCERDGIIKGYTVRLSDDAEANRLRAVVMISTDPKQADRVSVELKKMPEVRSLAALSGSYDLVAMVETDTPARIDALLDRIGRAPGVARTVSSIILSEKFVR